MTCINFFCILLTFVAIVCGGRIPDEKLLDEETYAEYQRRFPYGFDLRSVGPPTYETSYDLSPPPLPHLKSGRDSRTRFRERNPNSRNNGRNNNNNNNNRDPTDTNELTNGDENLLDLLFRADNSDKRAAFLREQQRLEDVRNFYNVGEIRKKREANPEPGRPRWKRTHCKQCGGGGYGGGGYGGHQAIPVYAVAVPVYSGGFGGHGGHGGGYIQKPSYGGGHGGGFIQKPSYGGGCNTCGSPGHGGGFGGGGFGGSFSHSSSQSSSSSGSWGYGRK